MWDSNEEFDVVELNNKGADINIKDYGGLELEDRVKNKGYAITMENGRVVGFGRIPSTEPEGWLFGRG